MPDLVSVWTTATKIQRVPSFFSINVNSFLYVGLIFITMSLTYSILVEV